MIYNALVIVGCDSCEEEIELEAQHQDANTFDIISAIFTEKWTFDISSGEVTCENCTDLLVYEEA